MINVRPIVFDDSDLTSNVALETEWTAGTYATNVIRRVGRSLYQVTAIPDTTDEPVEGAAKPIPSWVRIGSANRFAAFNNIISQPTVRESPIELTIQTTGLVNAVALFGVDAAEVEITVTDAVDGEVYNRVIPMADNGAVDGFYTYFFSPIIRQRQSVALDLPAYSGAAVKVELRGGDGEQVSLGELVLGTQRRLGSTETDFSVSYRDFSRRERNELGDFLILERPVARVGTFTVFMDRRTVPSVIDLLADLRTSPTVFVGSEDNPETVLFGFSEEPTIQRIAPAYSELSLEILGLT